MPRWPKRALVSLALIATTACPRAPRAPTPAIGEPELRIGLAVGLPNASIGGPEGGELFVSEAASGTAVGSIPAGGRWVVLPDSADPFRLRLLKPDSTRTDPLRGIAVVNVTERRFVVANGRRYRGRITITSGRGGLTVVNRVNVESYIAGVVPPEIGGRRPDEVAAVLAQAVVSRTFAIKNRGRWEAFGFDAYADTRDQVYLGVAVETEQAWDAVRKTAGQALRYDGEVIDAYFHSTCGFSTAGVEEGFATSGRRGGALLLRHLTAISLARRMGWLQAARYIVADAAHGHAALWRRDAAHHRRHGEPQDTVGPSWRAADRVRAWRHSDSGAGRACGAAARGGPLALQHRVSADGDQDQW